MLKISYIEGILITEILLFQRDKTLAECWEDMFPKYL